MWQKTFLIDKKINIESQAKCIANHINSYKLRPINVESTPGMELVRINFYRPCLEEKDDFIGKLIIKSTKSDTNKSTWIQDISFINQNEETLFHLKRFSRVYDSTSATHLSIKSFNVDYIKQEAIQIDPYLNHIFNQLTQDDIYIKLIDKKSNIYMASVFGGVIYHTKNSNE